MVRNNKGFTLVELMVVIVIIGILAALAIPKFNEASVKAKVSEAPTVLATVDNAVLARLAETSLLPTAWADLVVQNPTVANYSRWFTYAPADGAFPAAAGPMVATGAAVSTMGDVDAGDLVTTTIQLDATVAHTKNANYNRYLPNWQ